MINGDEEIPQQKGSEPPKADTVVISITVDKSS